MRKKTKRLGALGASALVALVVIGPAAGIAYAADTTTTGTATSTTVPKQHKVSGTETDNNNCASVLDLGSPGTPGQQDIGVTMSADAFPAPHLGDSILLSNTKLGPEHPRPPAPARRHCGHHLRQPGDPVGGQRHGHRRRDEGEVAHVQHPLVGGHRALSTVREPPTADGDARPGQHEVDTQEQHDRRVLSQGEVNIVSTISLISSSRHRQATFT